MQHVHEFEGLDIKPLCTYLAGCDVPLEPSQLYSGESKTKFVDQELRDSRFRALSDPAVLDVCEDIVADLNRRLQEKATPLMLTLVRNDATHIVYETGGFFKGHRDYLSLTSNEIMEMTLIVCVTPEGVMTQGGATDIVLNPEFTHSSTASTTRGSALLFRKDYEHAGQPVTDGQKHIVTLNIWAVPDRVTRVLHVTFGDEEGEEKAGAAEAEAAEEAEATPAEAAAQQESSLRHLRQLAKGATSYVLSEACVQQFPNSVLAEALAAETSADAAAAAAPVPHARTPVVYYRCREATFAEFGTVFKIMTGCRVTPDEVAASQRVFQVLGIKSSDVLLALAEEAKDSKPATAAPPEQVTPGSSPPSGTVLQAARRQLLGRLTFDEGRQHNDDYHDRGDEDDFMAGIGQEGMLAFKDTLRQDPTQALPPPPSRDIILCETEEAAVLVQHTALKLGQPFVRFCIMFAEGAAFHGGGNFGRDPDPLPLMPVWFSIGDYNNMIFYKRMMGTRATPFPQRNVRQFSEASPLPTGTSELIARSEANTLVRFIGESTADLPCLEWDYYNLVESKAGIAEWGLMLADVTGCKDVMEIPKSDAAQYKHARLSSAIHTRLFDGEYGDNSSILPRLAVVLPGGKDAPADKQPGGAKPECFHVDSHGKTCFSRDEANAAAARLQEVGVVDYVEKSLPHTPLRVPQNLDSSSYFFCNESVYLTASLITVHGVVRLP
eukprot:m.123831 g.123831  ORF g.123831 m.123831 type:complete len:721 (-) comp16604_c0_seq2:12-2174(-)